MKKLLHFLIAITFFIAPFKVSSQAINVQDSLALVDLYNNTGGPGWTNQTNWLTAAPVSSWFGILYVNGGRVIDITLYSNNLVGNIPSSIGNLSALTNLTLGRNHLSGSIPSSLGNLEQLIGMRFPFNQLTGTIPVSIGKLSNLSTIDLSENQLSGNIPDSLGNLPQLISLDLSYNQLSGSIPKSLGNLSQLIIMYLYHNQLSDSIPSSLGNLASLMYLQLDGNQLSGNIPPSLGNLAKLTNLELDGNQLSGSIPSSLGNLSRLTRLELEKNQLAGVVPSSLANNDSLYIDLSSNYFIFNGLELIAQKYSYNDYSPQHSIPLHLDKNMFSISAGGTLAYDTFRLFKNDTLSTTQIGDSVFIINNTGKYSVSVTNTIATKLTLYSDTVTIGFMLADTTTTVSRNISGTFAIDIDSGFYKLISITPTSGANALNGNVTTIVSIDSTVSIFHSQPYVQRHYNITPALNAATAQATVTLYFTQQDFDNFNNYVTSNNAGIPLLPTGGANNGNVRVIQLHGSFTAAPDPGNYNDTTTVLITPNVLWDNINSWWVVTFPVNGFSGFFLSTANFTLPLTLLEFKGKVHENTIALQWLTTHADTKEFVIERSINGTIFNAIGNVIAQPTSITNHYNFLDLTPLPGNSFYRLKMIDKDTKFTYSNIVQIKISKTVFKLSVYPNPAKGITTLLFSSIVTAKYMIEVTDQSGKIINRINGVSAIGTNKLDIIVRNYAKGTYFINLIDGENGWHSLKLNKQ